MEVGHSGVRGKEGGATTGGAAQGQLPLPVLDHQPLEAMLTEDVEAIEYLGTPKGVEADGARELVLQLLDGLVGYKSGFRHVERSDDLHAPGELEVSD